MNYPQRTKQEYKIDNREQILVDKKEYRDNNLELIHLRSLI
jgi:hypothetical protein